MISIVVLLGFYILIILYYSLYPLSIILVKYFFNKLFLFVDNIIIDDTV